MLRASSFRAAAAPPTAVARSCRPRLALGAARALGKPAVSASASGHSSRGGGSNSSSSSAGPGHRSRRSTPRARSAADPDAPTPAPAPSPFPPSLATAGTNSDADPDADALRAAQYNATMRERMAWRDPFQYHPDLGLYHHEVAPGVVVGTQLRGRREVDRLVEEARAGSILCLQEDGDAAHWGVDLGLVARHAEQRHGVRHLRAPARDFDGDSLRKVLPRAVALLERELRSGRRVYVHCTAGLGRAPAVAIAWRYWFREGAVAGEEAAAAVASAVAEGERGGGVQGGDASGGAGADADAAAAVASLDVEYDAVTSVRPCGPRRDAVRGATLDLLRRAAAAGALSPAAAAAAGLGGPPPPLQGDSDPWALPPGAAATLTLEARRAVQREVMALL